MTKRELLEKAKNIGMINYSSLNKEELKQALQEFESSQITTIAPESIEVQEPIVESIEEQEPIEIALVDDKIEIVEEPKNHYGDSFWVCCKCSLRCSNSFSKCRKCGNPQ